MKPDLPAGSATMTDILTGKPVQNPRKSRMSSIDAIQLANMYPNYCPDGVTVQGNCADGKPFLDDFHCDGVYDCAFAEENCFPMTPFFIARTHFDTINLIKWYFSVRQSYTYLVAQESHIIKIIYLFLFFQQKMS